VSKHAHQDEGERWRVYEPSFNRWFLGVLFSLIGLSFVFFGIAAGGLVGFLWVSLPGLGLFGWAAWRSFAAGLSDDGSQLTVYNWGWTRRLPWDQIVEFTDGRALGAGDGPPVWVLSARMRGGVKVKILSSSRVRIARLLVERATMHSVPVTFSPDADPPSPLGAWPQ